MKAIFTREGGLILIGRNHHFCIFRANTAFAFNRRCLVILGIGFAICDNATEE